MMKMKYFRFLFCRNGGCLLHYGELKDTRTGEHYNFLCLKGAQGDETEDEAEIETETETEEKKLFCCPPRLDMIVVEEMNSGTEEALRKILAQTETERLVYPGQERPAEDSEKRVKEIVRLSGGDEEHQESELSFVAAGWSFLIKSCGGGKLMMLHCLAEHNQGKPQGELRGRTPEGEKPEEYFEDCVMNVKGMDGRQKCMATPSPDGYECALGCILHRDYDVCSYRGSSGRNPGLTGTFLLPELSKEEIGRTVREISQSCREKVRFFVTGQPERLSREVRLASKDAGNRHMKSLSQSSGPAEQEGGEPAGNLYAEQALPGFEPMEQEGGEPADSLHAGQVLQGSWTTMQKGGEPSGNLHAEALMHIPGIEPLGETGFRNRKRYYIGSGQELRAGVAGEFFRGGIYQTPVLLKDGEGLCCSGFLKYGMRAEK